MGAQKAERFGEHGRRLKAKQAATLLKNVSDRTRLQIILLLSEAETNVTDMRQELGVSLPTLVHHTAILRYNGIIIPRRQGNNVYYSLSDNGELAAELIKKLFASMS
jgi:DNA-binding transcriptional ArsR family regulator